MYPARSAALAAIACLLLISSSRADKLYLTNGQVKDGKVVKKDATGVEFRAVMGEGKITFVKRYTTEEILKIETDDQSAQSTSPTEVPTESQPAAAPSSQPATRASSKIENKPEFLKKALAKVKDKPDVALIDLTHLVRASSGQELAELSELSKKEADQPLDELLASTRVQVAIKKKSGEIPKAMITEFEKSAMVSELHKVIEDCRGQKVGGTTIDAEIEEPEKYKDSGKDAREFLKHVTITLNLVTLATELDRPGRLGTSKAKATRDRRDTEKKDEATGTDEKAKSQEGSRQKGSDDLGKFKKQLLELQQVVRQASGAGGVPRRGGYGRTAGSSEDDQASGKDRTRGRRGASWRDRVPRDQRDVQGRDEEGGAGSEDQPPPPDRSRRGRRPPPRDDRGPDNGQRQDDRGPGDER